MRERRQCLHRNLWSSRSSLTYYWFLHSTFTATVFVSNNTRWLCSLRGFNNRFSTEVSLHLTFSVERFLLSGFFVSFFITFQCVCVCVRVCQIENPSVFFSRTFFQLNLVFSFSFSCVFARVVDCNYIRCWFFLYKVNCRVLAFVQLLLSLQNSLAHSLFPSKYNASCRVTFPTTSDVKHIFFLSSPKELSPVIRLVNLAWMINNRWSTKMIRNNQRNRWGVLTCSIDWLHN